MSQVRWPGCGVGGLGHASRPCQHRGRERRWIRLPGCGGGDRGHGADRASRSVAGPPLSRIRSPGCGVGGLGHASRPCRQISGRATATLDQDAGLRAVVILGMRADGTGRAAAGPPLPWISLARLRGLGRGHGDRPSQQMSPLAASAIDQLGRVAASVVLGMRADRASIEAENAAGSDCRAAAWWSWACEPTEPEEQH